MSRVIIFVVNYFLTLLYSRGMFRVCAGIGLMLSVIRYTCFLWKYCAISREDAVVFFVIVKYNGYILPPI